MAEPLKIALTSEWKPVDLGELANGTRLLFSTDAKVGTVRVSDDAKGEHILFSLYPNNGAFSRVAPKYPLFASTDAEKANLIVTPGE